MGRWLDVELQAPLLVEQEVLRTESKQDPQPARARTRSNQGETQHLVRERCRRIAHRLGRHSDRNRKHRLETLVHHSDLSEESSP